MVIRRYYKYLLAIVILVFLVINFRRLLVEPAQHTLIINEFAASNGGSLTDEDGDKSDWIELYNCNPFPVNLANWSLTDDPDQPDKWIFPDIVLPAGEYLVIFASGKDRVNHTNFKLNAQGGYLGLFQPTSRRYLDLSTIVYPPQSAGISYGRLNEHSAYFDIPTPGRANNEASAWLGLTPPVEFGVSRGFFEQPFTVTLVAATPDTVIYYTANGSEPTPRTGQRYANPISITRTTLLRAMAVQPKRKPSASVTHSYIFIADVLKQPQTPPGFPATWGTHAQDMVVKANDTLYAAGTPAIADYEMDPDIVDDPEYHDLLVEGLQTIPSLSIVTDLDAFTDLYSNPRERGVEWERPVSAEWIDPDGDDFQINAGLRIQGGTGRFEYVPKHSFRLFFRGEYGAPQLDFPLFPDSPVTQFNTLILRGGANRSYAGNKDARPRKTAYTRDEWLRRSQIEMSGSGSRGTFVHLYLNGLYWGLYNVVERPDAAFAASYFGGDKKNWHAHNHDGPISGDSTRVYALGEFMLENEHGGFGDPQNYALLQEYLDVEAFADYVILNWYAGNQDWDTSNWYALVKNPAGKVRFFVWDAEHTWTKGALHSPLAADKPAPRSGHHRRIGALGRCPLRKAGELRTMAKRAAQRHRADDRQRGQNDRLAAGRWLLPAFRPACLFPARRHCLARLPADNDRSPGRNLLHYQRLRPPRSLHRRDCAQRHLIQHAACHHPNNPHQSAYPFEGRMVGAGRSDFLY
ncbi:MAG: hypothetical protein B6243_13250 [Anaerolineaceae bacterium 4572_5.2]|nr:MAG: hypothetical protein B6243_13250 [Anaerolineaceae bacterium 4572_5.2]